MWVNCYLNNLKYRIFVPVVGINKGCYRAASPLERGQGGCSLIDTPILNWRS